MPLEDENDALEYAVEKAEEKSDDQIDGAEGVCPWEDCQGQKTRRPKSAAETWSAHMSVPHGDHRTDSPADAGTAHFRSCSQRIPLPRGDLLKR